MHEPGEIVSLPRLIQDRRWWLLLLLAWGLIVATSLWLQVRDIEHQSLRVATEGARNMFRMVELTRNWNASHGGVYVRVTEAIQPNPYLKHPKRDLQTTDGIALTMINPAYMTRLIAKLTEEDSGTIFHLTSLNPIRPKNAPDPWEQGSLTAFERGVPEVVEVVADGAGGQRRLRYMAPLLVKPACLQCHEAQGYRLGDVRGGISVSQRYALIEAASEAGRRRSVAIHLGVFLLISLGGWFLLAQLREKWQSLAAKILELDATRGELVQSEKMASLGRMVAGFAHEINTPVGVAIGAISNTEEAVKSIETLMGQEEVSEEELRQQLEAIQHGSQLAMNNLRRAGNLVQSFKRTSIDQSSQHSRVFPMRQLIDDVVFSLHNHLKRLPIEIEVDCDPGLQIDGLPGELEQVLANLILNAIQHGFDNGARGGHIRIGVEAREGQVRVLFADDGQGMSAEQREHIFEPFYTTRRGEGGSGLGLYICYNIVTSSLGGEIACESDPGSGTRFSIRFPATLVKG